MTRGGPAADQNGTVTEDDVTPPVEPEVPERRTVTFTSQGALKIERAGRQFRGLEQDVDAWNAEHQVYAPSRSPWDGDPRVQIFRPPEVDALPWFDWEATFHDGVHNLRAGLDNLCFELAHLDDVALQTEADLLPDDEGREGVAGSRQVPRERSPKPPGPGSGMPTLGAS